MDSKIKVCHRAQFVYLSAGHIPGYICCWVRVLKPKNDIYFIKQNGIFSNKIKIMTRKWSFSNDCYFTGFKLDWKYNCFVWISIFYISLIWVFKKWCVKGNFEQNIYFKTVKLFFLWKLLFFWNFFRYYYYILFLFKCS